MKRQETTKREQDKNKEVREGGEHDYNGGEKRAIVEELLKRKI